MRVQFFREKSLSLTVGNRLCDFDLRVGFAKSIDPKSGMTVNLVVVDQWLSETIVLLHSQVWSSEEEFGSKALIDLALHAGKESAELTRLELKEHQGPTWIWNRDGAPVKEIEFRVEIESPQEKKSCLLTLRVRHTDSNHIDFPKKLKIEKFPAVAEEILSQFSFLKGVRLEFLNEPGVEAFR